MHAKPMCLCFFVLLVLIASCRSKNDTPGTKLPGNETSYGVRILQLPTQRESPALSEQTRAILVEDLADAVLQTIRNGHIQSIRGRIQTGRERLAYELSGKGGSLMSVHPYKADHITGRVIAEIEMGIEAIRQDLDLRGIDPSALRKGGPCVMLDMGGWETLTMFRLVSASGESLKIWFRAERRRLDQEGSLYVLNGGNGFGGLWHAWLTDEEEKLLEEDDGWTEEKAYVLLGKGVNYRYLLAHFPWPDIFKDKHVGEHPSTDAYVCLSFEDEEKIRKSLTYSGWRESRWKPKGEEVMRVVFDENGNTKQVFLYGKELALPAPEREEH